MKSMNRAQCIISWCTVFAILTVVVNPPWVMLNSSERQFGPLWSPPPGAYLPDLNGAFFEIAVILIVSCLGLFLLRPKSVNLEAGEEKHSGQERVP